MKSKVEQLRDDVVAYQTAIDQARANFEKNKQLFSEPTQRNFERNLMVLQLKLDVKKTQLERIFPK